MILFLIESKSKRNEKNIKVSIKIKFLLTSILSWLSYITSCTLSIIFCRNRQ